MKKVLITGGAGFIGAHLATALVADGIPVDLVDDYSRGKDDAFLRSLAEQPGVRLISRDLTDPASIGEFDRDYSEIYHLAAIIGVANVLERPYDVLTLNARLTENALAIAANQKALSRFCFSSTSEVYAGTLLHFGLPLPTPESTPLALTPIDHPRTSYMLSKLYGEALCAHSPAPTTVVRFHNVYGPRMGMAHVIPELLKRAWDLQSGASLDVASVEHRRTFCYIDDAVALTRAVTEAENGENDVFNIGSQSPEIAIGSLAEIIIRTVGKPLTTTPLPPTPGSPERRCPDMTKTTRLTGLSAQVGLEDGIARTFDWYRENMFLQ